MRAPVLLAFVVVESFPEDVQPECGGSNPAVSAEPLGSLPPSGSTGVVPATRPASPQTVCMNPATHHLPASPREGGEAFGAAKRRRLKKKGNAVATEPTEDDAAQGLASVLDRLPTWIAASAAMEEDFGGEALFEEVKEMAQLARLMKFTE